MSKKSLIGFVAIFIFHLVGAISMSFDALRSFVVLLTPLHLLVTLILFFWTSFLDNKQIKLFCVLFLIGFWIEVIGVKTGSLFGVYEYGNTLGFKLLDVPLLIGVNWFLLSVSTYGVVSYVLKNKYVIIVVSSTLMVLLDLLIEPVAIHLDFWSWQNGVIPIQNYLMWWIVSAIMQLIIYSTKLRFNTAICIAIFLSQILFFTILNL